MSGWQTTTANVKPWLNAIANGPLLIKEGHWRVDIAIKNLQHLGMSAQLSQLIIPQHLREGDTIALVSSSWGGPGTFPWKYEKGKKQLEQAFGVKTRAMPFALATADLVEKSPQKRAEDLMNAFKDPNVKGIISTIGGDDSIRMLPYIDFDVIRNNPKVYLGYSDSTVSHFICLKAGIRSYYGPSLMAGFAENGGLFDYMEASVRQVLFSSETIGQLDANTKGWVVEQHPWNDPDLVDTPRKLKPALPYRWMQGRGCVSGRLIGGCIETMEHIKATDLWPKASFWKDSILFFETSEDTPSAEMVATWLDDYAAQGILQNANGILVGRPGGIHSDERFWTEQEDAFLRILHKYNLSIPLVTRVDIGHTDPQMVVPYGALLEIDCEQRTLTIPEAGCV